MTSQLLINESPLIVLPTLAKTIGLNEAIVLQQFHYWMRSQFNKNDTGGHQWIYRTYEKWKKQFPFLSERTIRRTIKNLESANFLLTARLREGQTKLYAINYELVKSICLDSQNAITADADSQSVPKEENLEAGESLNCSHQVPTKEFLGSSNQDVGTRSSKNSYPSSSLCSQATKVNDQNSFEAARTKAPNPNKSKWPARTAKLATIGQNDHSIRPNWPPQLAKKTALTGQIGHHTIKENTREITTENTPPPLSPPPQVSNGLAKEDEEENQQPNFESQPQSSPFVKIHNRLSTDDAKEDQLTSQEHQLFSEMIIVWNQTVQDMLNPGQDVRLTDKRKSFLTKFLNEVFSNIATDQKLGAWRNYCDLIAKSKFLSGQNQNGFKVTLDWALIPDNAYKVLEGAIYDKPEVPKKQQDVLTPEEFSEEIARSAPSSKYLTQWVKISLVIAKFLGQAKYRHWFSRVVLSKVTDTTATFQVEGNLTKDIIIRQYSSEIRCAVQKLYPKVHQIEFKVVSLLGDNA